MINKQTKLILWVLASLISLSGCVYKGAERTAVKEAKLDKAAIVSLDVKNLKNPAPNRFVSGQPAKAELTRLAKLGLKQVISLRGATEIDWDEAGYVKSLGLGYTSLAIQGSKDMTPENAEKLASLLESFGDTPVLIHCGSGSRVGGLMTLHFGATMDVETAVAKGKLWGLTGYEKRVREMLQANKASEPDQ